jgi:hypothetical protein
LKIYAAEHESKINVVAVQDFIDQY